MPKMPLKTPRNAKNVFAKYIRDFKLAHEDDFSEGFARTYGYLFKCLAELMRLETSEDLERRISELEKLVVDGGYKHDRKPN